MPHRHSSELPTLKPRTHCVLIPRDPDFVYAYWDYTEEDIKRLRGELTPGQEAVKFILRVHDNANHAWDLEVGFASKKQYIQVGQDNADYWVEIGLCSENIFIPLSRSNTVHVPPKSASKRDDLIWQDIKFSSKSRPYIKARLPHKSRIHHLSASQMRSFYRPRKGRMPSLEDVLAKEWPGQAWQKTFPVVTAPHLKPVHLGASESGLMERKAMHEDWFSSHLGAGASEERLGQRKFFFEVWTELLVHGRTEPDAAVWLNQKGVKLNPDGTFSLRFALPDGQIPLKFIAQSSDEIEQRHIYTRVEREKTIGFPKFLKENHG